MNATVEELDLAETLASRHTETPLWNELLDEYDADTLDDLSTGWPPLMDTTFEDPADEPSPDDPSWVEPNEAPDPQPLDEPEPPETPDTATESE